MRYTRAEMTRICREYGPQVAQLPEGIDGPQLLWAISGVESSFGANSKPRYEPAYGPGGRYFVAVLWEKHGRNSASSLGPWQLMFCNCPPNYTPEDMDDLGKAAAATVWFMNRQINRFKPVNLAAIAAIWNGGHPGAHRLEQVQRYIRKLEQYYALGMEEEVQT
jgi:hypothetical protein